jgi:protein TonB
MVLYRLAFQLAIGGLFVSAVAQTTEQLTVRSPSVPESQILRKVAPDYPASALRNRIQGAVALAVVIGKDGHIEQVRVLSGHPLLRRAAQKAVRQWVYRPQYIAGNPVRVFTEVAVQFVLDRQGNPIQVESNTAPVLPL